MAVNVPIEAINQYHPHKMIFLGLFVIILVENVYCHHLNISIIFDSSNRQLNFFSKEKLRLLSTIKGSKKSGKFKLLVKK